MEDVKQQGAPLTRIEITTNFFPLLQAPFDTVAIYSYSFTPEIETDNRSLRTYLLNKARAQIELQLGLVIRSGNTLYSKITLTDPISIPVLSHTDVEYILVITYANKVLSDNVETYRMYANSALKKMLQCLGLKQITKLPKYYDIRRTERVEQHHIEVWKGYTASFSHHLKEMLLNIDFSSKIIRDTTALQAMEEIRKSGGHENLAVALANELVGQIVMAKYGNFKCYRIEAIILEENPTMSFETSEGPISYIQYFRQKYNLNIRYERQPLIRSSAEKGTKVIKLIPELCVLTGISENIKRDYRAMNDIAYFTRLEPKKRFEVSRYLARGLTTDQKCVEIANEYGIQISPDPIVLNGYKFEPDAIKAGTKDFELISVDRKGSFMLRSSILKPVEIKNWALLIIERDYAAKDLLIKTLKNKAEQIKLTLGAVEAYDYNPRNIESMIRLVCSGQQAPLPQIVLVVVPPNDKKIYNSVKSLCALSLGVPTQFIRANNLSNNKKFDSIMSKLIVQMAVKTGSLAWQFSQNIPGLPFLTMVVGIDVFHDTVQKAKSVLGFVASIHPQFTSYFNTTRIHDKSGQEIAGQVGECMLEALKAFFEATKRRHYPEVIIVYRDGLADSQIKAAKDAEVNSIRQVMLNSLEGCAPKLVYVIVNKRTNAKLFSNGPNGLENPPPGTLVNSMVIPEDQSFYLISHFVTQGIASPTLYRIIENDSNIQLMVIAKLAFKLCYMYYNWTGGIKVPAPTMMAHKLAFLVGQSVHQTHLEQLRLLPWFY